MPSVLSSALRKDSIDFRSDGAVRCQLAVSNDSKATFAGVAGAKVTLAGIAHPTSDFEAATKYYVDSVAAGLTVKGSVNYSVEQNLVAEYSQDHTALAGAGAFLSLAAATLDVNPANGSTLLAQSTNAQFLAGYAAIVANADETLASRFLVRSQTDKKQNGVYFLEASSSTGYTLRRSANFNDDPTGEIKAGSFVFVTSGFRHANHGFVLVSDDASRIITLNGATPNNLQFEQFSGAGQLTAGTNMNKQGDTISLNANIDITNVSTDTVTARQHAEFNSTVHADGAVSLGSTLSVISAITAAAEGHTLANFTVNNGSLTSTSQQITFGSNQLTTSGAVTFGSTLGVTSAITAASEGHTLADFAVNNGSIVSSSGAISLGANDVTTTGFVHGAAATFSGAAVLQSTLAVTSAITAAAQGHTLADFTVNNGSIVSGSGAISHGANDVTTTGYVHANDAEFSGYASVTGISTLSGPVKAQAKTFIGCAALQPNGSATAHAWTTDKVSDGNGGYIWEVLDDPLTKQSANDAALVVGGKAYFDANVNIRSGLRISEAGSDGLVIVQGGMDTAMQYIRLTIYEGLVMSSASIQLDSGRIMQNGRELSNNFNAPVDGRATTIMRAAGHNPDNRKYNPPAYDVAAGTWSWADNAAWPITGVYDDYSSAALIVDGRAFIDGKLIVTGALGANVQGPVDFGNTLSVTGIATLVSNATVGGTFDVTGASHFVDVATFDAAINVSSLAVTNSITAGTTLSVTGASTLTGNVLCSAIITAATPGQVLADFTFSNGSIESATPTVSVNNALSVSGASALGSTLSVAAAADLATEIFVHCSAATHPASAYLPADPASSVACKATVEGSAYVSGILHAQSEVRSNAVTSSNIGVSNANGAYQGGKNLTVVPTNTIGNPFDVTDANMTSDASLESWSVNVGPSAQTLNISALQTNFTAPVAFASTSVLSAPAQGHLVADFTFNNGSLISASPTISHGSNNVTTTGDVSSNNISFTTLLSGATATFTSDCTAQNFYATSDETLKTEIRQIEGAVAQCQKLRGVEFKWKQGADQRDQIGVIAQEVEGVYPTLVAEIDGHKRVDYSKLVGLLIEAVKELSAELNELKAR